MHVQRHKYGGWWVQEAGEEDFMFAACKSTGWEITLWKEKEKKLNIDIEVAILSN
jgi:hypothetical protein